MSTTAPKTVYLKDYRASDFAIDSVSLYFDLHADHTLVHNEMQLRAPELSEGQTRALSLHGRQLTLESIAIDDIALRDDDYIVDDEQLILFRAPHAFKLTIVTRIEPQNNTSLEGLYTSSSKFCTQCEAEGFRKITYYLDRPDVMSVFTTTIEADKGAYPVLLSNGNPIEQGDLDNGRHFVTWHDPFKKPSYLFALVAGNLHCVEDSFITVSGRRIVLRIFVEQENIDRCEHAMQSLKQAMRWDEQVYGREYDLDIFMIVAVNDFNMGAMENKGLNIFNSACVLARPETSTDGEYERILGIVGHEYFHNWTGNRVTCRDWFQLSLKEGLTVFRDQEFTGDLMSRPVQRIGDVRILRSAQFSQDAGPMAHPVRPDAYIEISNFYTVTVYNKGAEVVRMIHTLLGAEGFRRGMDLYFQQHDGQAVTTEDFVAAMADANSYDLTQFQRWYDQAGTPQLEVKGIYDQAAQSYTLHVKQSCPATPGQPDKAPFHIPLAVGLVGANGEDLPLRLVDETVDTAQTSRVFSVTAREQRFTFQNIAQRPVPSLLRGFSAPVRLRHDLSDDDLIFLMAQDSDPFVRWDSGQTLACKRLLQLADDVRHVRPLGLDAPYVQAFSTLLADESLDRLFLAQAMGLPGEAYLAEESAEIDPEAIFQASVFLRETLARALWRQLAALYRDHLTPGGYQFAAADAGRRAVKNQALSYMMFVANEEVRLLCWRQYETADNMTDRLAALANLVHVDCPERAQALDDFYQRWQHDTLVMDKWFALQSGSRLPGALEQVKALSQHGAYDGNNPNKVRALVGSFCNNNLRQFHAIDGAGYAFLADQVLAHNRSNPIMAARLLTPLTGWRRYEPIRQGLMRAQLERIMGAQSLSRDVYEVVSKSLM